MENNIDADRSRFNCCKSNCCEPKTLYDEIIKLSPPSYRCLSFLSKPFVSGFFLLAGGLSGGYLSIPTLVKYFAPQFANSNAELGSLAAGSPLMIGINVGAGALFVMSLGGTAINFRHTNALKEYIYPPTSLGDMESRIATSF